LHSITRNQGPIPATLLVVAVLLVSGCTWRFPEPPGEDLPFEAVYRGVEGRREGLNVSVVRVTNSSVAFLVEGPSTWSSFNQEPGTVEWVRYVRLDRAFDRVHVWLEIFTTDVVGEHAWPSWNLTVEVPSAGSYAFDFRLIEHACTQSCRDVDLASRTVEVRVPGG